MGTNYMSFIDNLNKTIKCIGNFQKLLQIAISAFTALFIKDSHSISDKV